MSVEILDHCPSCGVCSRPGVCPIDAIKVENGKTFVAEGCIDCGLCIPVCPIGVIVESNEPVQAAPVKQESKPAPQVTSKDEQQVEPVDTSTGGEEADHEETSTGA